MATARVNGTDLGYETQGDGRDVVVLLHGVGADRGAWAFQVPALVGAGYRVLSVDLRGTGGSSVTPGP